MKDEDLNKIIFTSAQGDEEAGIYSYNTNTGERIKVPGMNEKNAILDRLNELDARIASLTATAGYIDRNVAFLMTAINVLGRSLPKDEQDNLYKNVSSVLPYLDDLNGKIIR